MRRVVNGVELNVLDERQGPELMLVHGVGGSVALWDDVARALAGSHRVIRFDLRGFGGSGAPQEPPFSLGLWARDAKALLEQLEVSRAIVAGHGLGAAIALELALDFPQATRGIVLVSPFISVPPPAAASVRQQMEAAERQGMAAVAALLRQQLAPPGSSPARLAAFERFERSLLATSPSSFARAVRAMMQVDLSERIADVAKPTLVVASQHDPLVPLNLAREVEEAISGARLQVLPNVGHLAPLEAPAELARLIAEFSATAGRF